MADKLFPLRVDIPIGVDAKGAQVFPSREFVRQWNGALFPRVGEYDALSNPELEALIDQADGEPEGQGIQDIEADVYQLRDELTQQPPQGGFFTPDVPADARIQALEEIVSEMFKAIEALKQGATP